MGICSVNKSGVFVVGRLCCYIVPSSFKSWQHLGGNGALELFFTQTWDMTQKRADDLIHSINPWSAIILCSFFSSWLFITVWLHTSVWTFCKSVCDAFIITWITIMGLIMGDASMSVNVSEIVCTCMSVFVRACFHVCVEWCVGSLFFMEIWHARSYNESHMWKCFYGYLLMFDPRLKHRRSRTHWGSWC